MRILHFSDVHIGVESYGTIDQETGLSARLGDFLSTFDEVVEFAINKEVDLVLFAGDAYKSRDPSQTHQREFAKRIARITQAGVPVFLLVGNHDIPHISSRATALEIFPTLSVPFVTVGDNLKTYRIETLSGVIQIIALPWIRRSTFLARDETRSLNIEQINQQLQERVTNLILREIDSLDESIPAILTGHVSLNTAMTSSEQSMLLGRDPILMQSTIANSKLDYVALGHIHKHQVLSYNPYIAYSGSLERVDFGEEKDTKGFCVVDIDPTGTQGNRLVGFNFQTVSARRFITINVDVSVGDDPTEKTLLAISKLDIRDCIVRVKITMPQEVEALLREDQIREKLVDAKFITPIVKDVERSRRTRLGNITVEMLTTQEALESYFKITKVDQNRRKLLMRYAENLINDEEIDA
jgi:exonuclease SbcD